MQSHMATIQRRVEHPGLALPGQSWLLISLAWPSLVVKMGT